MRALKLQVTLKTASTVPSAEMPLEIVVQVFPSPEAMDSSMVSRILFPSWQENVVMPVAFFTNSASMPVTKTATDGFDF